MTKNWKNVITDPALGFCSVSCSKVMALLQQPPKIREKVSIQSETVDSIFKNYNNSLNN
jgi:hypothetical protein